MKAVRVLQFGGPEALKLLEVAIPKPQAAEVLVNVKAAGVNPVDTYIRSGTYARSPSLPYTPGRDGAGIVHQIGEAVTRFKPGDRVWFCLPTTGSYAEYALCEEKNMRILPDPVSFEQGAALGIPHLIAHRALFLKCKGKPGETVLIHGASGGVGVAASQLALAHGLKVFGTAGSEDGASMLKSFGVHRVFNHRKKGYMNEIKEATGGTGVNIILEMLANINLANDLKTLAVGGRLVVIGSRGPIEINPRDMMAKELSVYGTMLNEAEMPESFAAVEKYLEDGKLQPIIGSKYALSEAPEAHKEIIETKAAKGKMVLVTSSL